MERPRYSGLPDRKMMCHSPESFSRLWDEATDGHWQVESATLKPLEYIERFGQMLTFVVRKKAEE